MRKFGFAKKAARVIEYDKEILVLAMYKKEGQEPYLVIQGVKPIRIFDIEAFKAVISEMQEEMRDENN